MSNLDYQEIERLLAQELAFQISKMQDQNNVVSPLSVYQEFFETLLANISLDEEELVRLAMHYGAIPTC